MEVDSLNAVALELLVSRPQEALLVAEKARTKAVAINYLVGESDALTALAYAHQYEGELSMSISLLSVALDKRIEIGQQKLVSKAYSNLADAYQLSGEPSISLRYGRKALSLADEKEDARYHALLIHKLGKTHFAMDHLDSSAYYLNRAKDRLEKLELEMDLADLFLDFGILEYQQGRYAVAKDYVHRALKVYDKLDHVVQAGYCYKILALISEEFDHRLEVVQAYEKAFRYADSTAVLGEMADVAQYFADYLHRQNDVDASLWYERALRFKDSLASRDRTDELARWQARFESGEKSREIAEMKAIKAENDKQLAERKQWIYALLALIFLIGGSAGILTIRNRQRTEREKNRIELKFRKDLLDATVNAQEEERQRIAKDLHDGLVQTLAAIKMGLQSIGRKLDLSTEMKTTYEAKVKMVDDAADEARLISHQMMPRVLLELGLVPAIEDMLSKTLQLSEIKYHFENFGLNKIRFAKNIEIGLYRICQELVNNIIKHSHASQVAIQLYKTSTHLILHVEDNGKGFNVSDSQKKRGLGLSNIFSRASAVNGEVSYEEGQSKGTIANIRIPIASPKSV